MRVRRVRISGFKAIPSTARLLDRRQGPGRRHSLAIDWGEQPFEMWLPVEGENPGSLLAAIIGANSTGKSSILQAMACAFGTVAKLDPLCFHQKDTARPVMIEMLLQGSIAQPSSWHRSHCTRLAADLYQITVVHVWQDERRARYALLENDRYYQLGHSDRAQLEALLPVFRFIDAHAEPGVEADLGGGGLLGDLLDWLITHSSVDSALNRMDSLLEEVRVLALDMVDTEQNAGWRDLAELEAQLTRHVTAIAPTPHQVRFSLAGQIPSVREIFALAHLTIDNGTPIDLPQHGRGMQRALVVSALRAWCDYVRKQDRDYLFAIEEPEIYLHPHATRVLMALLEEISSHSQVIFTTHASDFVNRVALENTVIVRTQRQPGHSATAVAQPALGHLGQDNIAKVQRYLLEDRSDMLFARAVLLVEGQAELFALPAFARTIGLDLDYFGCSVVFVNGIGNFATYHEILAAFQIPHVILVDGDGRQRDRQRVFGAMADALFVLDDDFESLLVAVLRSERLLALMNECLRRRGRQQRNALAPRSRRVKELAALGKPLVGRVAGEMLTADEVERMNGVVDAIWAVVATGRN